MGDTEGSGRKTEIVAGVDGGVSDKAQSHSFQQVENGKSLAPFSDTQSRGNGGIWPLLDFADRADRNLVLREGNAAPWGNQGGCWHRLMEWTREDGEGGSIHSNRSRFQRGMARNMRRCADTIARQGPKLAGMTQTCGSQMEGQTL
jgi:hypothetical protein